MFEYRGEKTKSSVRMGTQDAIEDPRLKLSNALQGCNVMTKQVFSDIAASDGQMSITPLSDPLEAQCYYLEVDGYRLLLDCGVNWSKVTEIYRDSDGYSMLEIPEFDRIEISSLDAVLISNPMNMLALPYLTEMTGFEGAIWATRHTMEFGRALMHQIIDALSPKALKNIECDQRNVPKCPVRNRAWCRIDIFRNLSELTPL